GGRNRRGRSGGGRKGGLNFRELQSKIVPELHLLAKEVGLEDYRQMSKDDLALAILERSAEGEGLKLVQGYLEISSDGYGFLPGYVPPEVAEREREERYRREHPPYYGPAWPGFYHGRWNGGGFGPCWTNTPIGYVWNCGK
ncbi:MAG: Rho termination factor N-terminal domain-containing protein, partial [Pseudolabrys sp.]